MPEYLTTGVYIGEIERRPRPKAFPRVRGVPGEAERGPNKPRGITSYKEYKRWFDCCP